MKKRLLVDLSSLKNIYSGLGQIALSYGNYFKENYKSKLNEQIGHYKNRELI